MFSIAGKRAYITGGSSGIGRAVAEIYVEHGAQVVIADIVDASEVAQAIGATSVLCNVADGHSISIYHHYPIHFGFS